LSKKRGIRVILVAVLLYQCWVLYLTFSHPNTGINVTKNAEQQWIIESFDSRSIGSELQLKAGDVLVAVNGAAPEEHWPVYRWRTLDQAATITVQQEDGAIRQALVDPRGNLGGSDLFPLLAECFSMLIAYVLYKKVSNSYSSRYLSAVFLDIGLLFTSLPASVRGDALGKILMSAFMVLLPIVFFHFLTVFLKEKGQVHISSFFLKPAYIAAAILLGVRIIYFFDTPVTFSIYNILRTSDLLLAVLGVCANFWLLFYIYAKHRKEVSYVSVIIKTVLVSLFLSFSPAVVFSFLPKILFGKMIIDSFYMSWFVFIFPLSFVYLLATRRLYDVNIIMRRMLFTVVIALVPSLLLAGMIKFFFPLEATLPSLALVFVLLLLSISFILYSLEHLTTKLEPVLFPRKHRLQLALKNITRNLTTISSLRELKDIILVDIVETLEVAGGAILIKYKDRMETIYEGNVRKSEVEEFIVSGAGNTGEASCYICFEISRQEEYTSYLVMTEKKTSARLGMEEVQWINLIITYLSISLENVQLISKLDGKIQQLSALLPEEEEANNLIWFRKLMFELQEKERIRIAMDLHDTTMQDLFLLKRRLQIMQDKYPLTQEMKSYIDGMTDYIEIINKNLRQNCFELHPYLLKEIGLVATLNKLFQTEREICSFKIHFITSEISEIEEQEMEIKRHIFRMVQELLHNAKKYAYANTVRFSICIEQSWMYFEYADDGIGFEPSRPVVREIGSAGIGMEQMKNRVLSLGGTYELDSGTGKGVRFQAQFPIQMHKELSDESV
jgi:two-component system sensor histidine kinase ComP